MMYTVVNHPLQPHIPATFNRHCSDVQLRHWAMRVDPLPAGAPAFPYIGYRDPGPTYGFLWEWRWDGPSGRFVRLPLGDDAFTQYRKFCVATGESGQYVAHPSEHTWEAHRPVCRRMAGVIHVLPRGPDTRRCRRSDYPGDPAQGYSGLEEPTEGWLHELLQGMTCMNEIYCPTNKGITETPNGIGTDDRDNEWFQCRFPGSEDPKRYFEFTSIYMFQTTTLLCTLAYSGAGESQEERCVRWKVDVGVMLLKRHVAEYKSNMDECLRCYRENWSRYEQTRNMGRICSRGAAPALALGAGMGSLGRSAVEGPRPCTACTHSLVKCLPSQPVRTAPRSVMNILHSSPTHVGLAHNRCF